eukprot:5394076-Alexandrium_andersonii.AAC.1
MCRKRPTAPSTGAAGRRTRTPRRPWRPAPRPRPSRNGWRPSPVMADGSTAPASLQPRAAS